jgi:cytochrome c6
MNKNLLILFLFLGTCNGMVLWNPNKGYATNFETGKEIFQNNCSACHSGGNNLIIPEKNLKKDALEANGMNTVNAITYQVINGKNGMPAFGGRLNESEIENVALYVLKQSANNFVEK